MKGFNPYRKFCLRKIKKISIGWSFFFEKKERGLLKKKTSEGKAKNDRRNGFQPVIVDQERRCGDGSLDSYE